MMKENLIVEKVDGLVIINTVIITASVLKVKKILNHLRKNR